MSRSMLMPALSLLLVASCRQPDPPWSVASSGVAGDGTTAGAAASIPRAASAPVIDGKLDDATWTNAVVLGPFGDASDGKPQPGHPVAGWARALWDDRNLYLGVIVRDRAPRSPFPRETVDPAIWTVASAIEVMLQPGDPRDNRNYYELQVDVAGAVFDTRWDDYNQPITGEGDKKVFGHLEWSSRMERAVYVHEGSFYSVELAIPWSSLQQDARTAVPPRAGDVWRMNLYSFREGQRLAQAWSPIRRQGNFHKSSRFGRVKFE